MSITLDVVLGERQVELAAREGRRAVMRRKLLDRLATAFLPHVRFADAVTCRAALSQTLASADEHLVDAVDDALSRLRPRGVTAQALGEMEQGDRFVRQLRSAMNALDSLLDRVGLVDARLRGERLATALVEIPVEDVARVVGATHLRARHIID
jgi:hypothetical protein